jgi:hypothetical protein
MHSSQSESHLRVTVTESRLRAIEGVAPTGTHTELRLRAIEGVAPTGTHTELRLRAIEGVAPTGTHTESRLRAIEGVTPTGTHTELRPQKTDDESRLRAPMRIHAYGHSRTGRTYGHPMPGHA